MIALFKKYPAVLLILFLLAFLMLVWLFPSTGFILGIIFLFFSLVIASFAIVKKHREAYLQGESSRNVFIRNVILEIVGILCTMVLASLLAKYVVEIATRQISDDLTKFIAGICLGLLVGITVGVFIQRVFKKFVWLLIKREPETSNP